MSSVGEEDTDAVLSDIESENPSSVLHDPSSSEGVSPEKYRELLAELEHERRDRLEIENSKSELQEAFNKLKIFTHKAIKLRDENSKQRDDALREKEEHVKLNEKLRKELADTTAIKDDLLKQNEDVAKQLEENAKERDSLRSEMETSTHMMMTGIEKVSEKVMTYKNFVACGFPKSHKYSSGLPSVAYGIIKRANEIVEELLRQIDSSVKARDETREQMSYEIAIEVSQLEAAISQLREEVHKKTKSLEDVEERIGVTEKEKTLVEEELKKLEKESTENTNSLGIMNPLMVEQLSRLTKIHDQLLDAVSVIDPNDLVHSALSKSLFLPQETNAAEIARACLAATASVHDVSHLILSKSRDLVEEKNREGRSLKKTVSEMSEEKQKLGFLLKRILSKTAPSDSSDAPDESISTTDVHSLAYALDDLVKSSLLDIAQLNHTVDQLRAESGVLRERLESLSKEMNRRKVETVELEEKQRLAIENIEGLMGDLAEAEEEIKRWKIAAEQEAAAGRAVDSELTSQIMVLRDELAEVKDELSEVEKKMKSKEDVAAAAMAAREAAEKSLSLADSRASRLRDRAEELAHLLDQAHARAQGAARDGSVLARSRYVCWPWNWLGLDSHPPALLRLSSNEMELSEPLV